jgi:hypothetical protein
MQRTRRRYRLLRALVSPLRDLDLGQIPPEPSMRPST